MTKTGELRGERQLVRSASHDPDAFRQLYRYYFRRVYAYISYRVGRVQDAEDLTAETFLKALEGLPHFRWRGKGSFAAWLFRIAHNLVSNFYRTEEKAPEPIPPERLPDLPGDELMPGDTLARKELLARLRRLIGMLSPRQQEIVTLRFFGGLRNKEIAALLDLDERTVAAHLCRGVRKLKTRYEALAAQDGTAALIEREVSRG
ncbi:MAG: RNA polymerase sigma factor [Anaerolineae bacterium]